MKTLRLFLTVICFATMNVQLHAAVCIVVSSGKWDQTATWSGGVLPSCGDSIVIGEGKIVEISEMVEFMKCSIPAKLNISGKLVFQSDKKLNLPCKSVVQLNTGGSISTDNSNFKSSRISICNAVVWNDGMGTLSGPLALQLNPAPAQVVDFTANPEGSIVVLNWVTSSELNNDFFTVEKSRNGIDFEELGQFDAAGTSTNINSYKVYDIIPFDGLQFYRLRQTDFENQAVVSRTIAVKWSKGTECSIYPNPTKGELSANLDTKKTGKKGQLLVNNADGKLLLSKEIQFESSGYGVKLLQEEELLKPGNYLVTLNFNDKSFSQYVVSR